MKERRNPARVICILLMLFFSAPSFAANALEQLSEEQTKLLDGETVIFLERNDDDIIDVSGSIYIRSVPETIWAVITDYDNLADTMPRVRKSRVVEDNGNVKIVEQTSKTGVLFFKIKFSTRVAITETFPDSVSFKLLSGDFKTFDGKWVLTPHEKSGTFVNWSARVKPDFSAPGFIIDAVQKRDLRELLETIKDLSEPETTTSGEDKQTAQQSISLGPSLLRSFSPLPFSSKFRTTPGSACDPAGDQRTC